MTSILDWQIAEAMNGMDAERWPTTANVPAMINYLHFGDGPRECNLWEMRWRIFCEVLFGWRLYGDRRLILQRGREKGSYFFSCVPQKQLFETPHTGYGRIDFTGSNPRVSYTPIVQENIPYTRPTNIKNRVFEKDNVKGWRAAWTLREVFGNPFDIIVREQAPPARELEPGQNIFGGKAPQLFRREWLTNDVLKLAAAASCETRKDRDPNLYGILADALEDADCNLTSLIAALRAPCPDCSGSGHYMYRPLEITPVGGKRKSREKPKEKKPTKKKCGACKGTGVSNHSSRFWATDLILGRDWP